MRADLDVFVDVFLDKTTVHQNLRLTLCELRLVLHFEKACTFIATALGYQACKSGIRTLYVNVLVPLDAKERPILLDIIEDRHGRKSIIITSQLPVSSWYDAIGDPTVADAILDRIVHTAHQIELSGESIRKIKAEKEKK